MLRKLMFICSKYPTYYYLSDNSNDDDLEEWFNPDTNMKGELNGRRILEQIEKSGDAGIATSELETALRLDRDTIYTHTEYFRKKGVISKLYNKDRYRMIKYAAKDFDKQSQLFGMEGIREIMNDFPSMFGNRASPLPYLTSLAERERSLFENVDNKELKNETSFLLDFAMKSGVLITFSMLKAIELLADKGNEKESENMCKTWLKNSINPGNLLFQFMLNDIIRYSKPRMKYILNKQSERSGQQEDDSSSRTASNDSSRSDNFHSPYVVDEKTYKILKESFKEIWPYSYICLESIMQKLYAKSEDSLRTLNNEDRLLTKEKLEQIKKNSEEKLSKRRQSNST